MTQLTIILAKYSNEKSTRIDENKILYENWANGLITPNRVWIETWYNGPYGNPWSETTPEIFSNKEAKEMAKWFENKPNPEEQTSGMWQVNKMRIDLIL